MQGGQSGLCLELATAYWLIRFEAGTLAVVFIFKRSVFVVKGSPIPVVLVQQ
jgi:hypothetical protein